MKITKKYYYYYKITKNNHVGFDNKLLKWKTSIIALQVLDASRHIYC